MSTAPLVRTVSSTPELLPSAKSAAIHSKYRANSPADTNALSARISRAAPAALSKNLETASQESGTTSGSEPNPDQAAAAPVIRFKANKHMDVIIHVYDESKNAKRDFFCQRGLLLRHMTYFTSYLHNHAADATVEIDVHCDIEVFQWLMSYISRKRPLFEPRIALSILISSNFLQMAALEDLCIRYIYENMNEVLKVPIDMGCLSQTLVEKLTRLFTIDDMQNIDDPQDKILNQLYYGKLLELLSSLSAKRNAICACRLCGKLYALTEEPQLFCNAAAMQIGLNGEVSIPHERDTSFNINEYIANSQTRNSWKDMYWM
ncbi:hypothetical protein PhCBS80983_g01577 [Powellomyces hirtus]|uniref:SANT and BTB domain-containing protein n=1 Tax=Powellomyces hirtus TaxID=109895 RepID=A0A507E9J0_9FUNG|nr:hypothetical protein PhCBS80983_g01577 [Powellomyces hirtus]